MDIAKNALREDVIAAHHVQQAGDAGVRGQARRQGIHKGGAQENRLEQLAAHVQRNLRQRRVRVFKAANIGKKSCIKNEATIK
jgi:hypothetical protein